MKKTLATLSFLLFGTNFFCLAQQTVTFPSIDQLPVTADLYKINETSPFIVLCHLSEHSRGEYKETAKRLNELGFNCLAVDTRTGNEIFGVVNQTALKAKELNAPNNFLDSEQDIVAAVNYAADLNNGKKIILLGSSFSASLCLKIATANDLVKAVIAFSPGEYFGEELNLKETIKDLNKPVFVTSSKSEVPDVTNLITGVKSKNKVQFIPIGDGAHGSIALWDYNTNNKEYWDALVSFLKVQSN